MTNFKINKNNTIGTAAISAVSLKLCCWGPLLLTGVAGVSGSSVYFSWLIALKPYLLGITYLSLGFAIYQVYNSKKNECSCSINIKSNDKPSVKAEKSFLRSKLYVWLVAVFVILMTSISYFPQMFYSSPEKEIVLFEKTNIETLKLHIEGMTCTGCEENINHSVNKLEGIVEINTSQKKGTSKIKFDRTKTNIKEIEAAIRSKGYVIKNSL